MGVIAFLLMFIFANSTQLQLEGIYQLGNVTLYI